MHVQNEQTQMMWPSSFLLVLITFQTLCVQNVVCSVTSVNDEFRHSKQLEDPAANTAHRLLRNAPTTIINLNPETLKKTETFTLPSSSPPSSSSTLSASSSSLQNLLPGLLPLQQWSSKQLTDSLSSPKPKLSKTSSPSSSSSPKLSNVVSPMATSSSIQSTKHIKSDFTLFSASLKQRSNQAQLPRQITEFHKITTTVTSTSLKSSAMTTKSVSLHDFCKYLCTMTNSCPGSCYHQLSQWNK